MNPPASPFLSPGHWSYGVLRRLDHAGWLPRGADIARQSMPQEEIASLLALVDSARGTNYLRRFRAEFTAARPDSVTVLQRTVETGYRWHNDLFAPGIGYDSLNWTGARRLDDETEYLYGFRFGVSLYDHFALGARIAGNDPEYQATATAGYLGAWLGQRKIGYGVGAGGGLVLNAHELLGGGVYIPRPLRLPLLGAVRFEMHAAQIDNVLNLNGVEREIEPWFWTARGSFEPFHQLRIGINRGMMFGGEGNTPVTFSRVAKNIIGIYADDNESNFANQVISIDFRLRAPGVPLTAYLDWGSDDAAGGWWDVPAVLGGVEYVHVDSTFDVALGAEHLQFSGSCCSNSIWYRNAWFRGSWADGDEQLGHPLGGHGREWRVFSHGSFGGGSVTAHAAFYARRRRAENILVTAWQGSSSGLGAGVDFSLRRDIRVVVDGEVEWGADDWSASQLLVALRSRF